MTTITLRIDEKDGELIKRFIQFKGLSVSDFARKAMLEKIEDEYDLQDLRKAMAEDDGTRYTMEQVKEELGF